VAATILGKRMRRYIAGGPVGCQSAVRAPHKRLFATDTPPLIVEHTL